MHAMEFNFGQILLPWYVYFSGKSHSEISKYRISVGMSMQCMVILGRDLLSVNVF